MLWVDDSLQEIVLLHLSTEQTTNHQPTSITSGQSYRLLLLIVYHNDCYQLLLANRCVMNWTSDFFTTTVADNMFTLQPLSNVKRRLSWCNHDSEPLPVIRQRMKQLLLALHTVCTNTIWARTYRSDDHTSTQWSKRCSHQYYSVNREWGQHHMYEQPLSGAIFSLRFPVQHSCTVCSPGYQPPIATLFELWIKDSFLLPCIVPAMLINFTNHN